MRQDWFIIDRWGRRPVRRAKDYWHRIEQGDDIDWPEFNQLVTCAPTHLVVKALHTFASALGVSLVDVTYAPQRWSGALLVGNAGEVSVVGEPDTDAEDRLLQPDSADAIHGLLADDGAFFGYEPETGTVHVTRYDLGVPTLEWCDSIRPGPSFARTFLSNGRAQDEEPRRFALRQLGLAESSPLLDRYEFVLHTLGGVGLERVSPTFEDIAIAAAFRLG